MKNKILILLFLSILCFIHACTPEEIEMNDISDIFITWSPLSIHVNDSVSLGDGSRGEVWRKWTFPEGGVCKIIGTNELTSSERVVHGIFYAPGLYDVRLQAEFNDPSIQLDSLITVTVLEISAVKLESDYLTSDKNSGMDLGDMTLMKPNTIEFK